MVEEWWNSVLKGVCVQETYFEHSSLHKYTRVARVHDIVEVKSMKDLVLVKKDMLHYVQDVRAVRGMGRNLSDHHIVVCKVGLVEALTTRKEVECRAMRIKSEKLREHQYR